MYIITDKNGIVISISPTLDYQENGNPLVQDAGGNTYAIAAALVGETFGDIEVPEGYGVGDSFDGAEWTKNEALEEASPTTLEGRVTNLESDFGNLLTGLEAVL